MKTNPLFDAYIEKSQPFAKPILQHLRKLVHQTCPEVEEKIKWGMPFFDYKGMLCHLASFKQHCSFGFWKASLMSDPILMTNAASESAMGHLGKITSLKDLPSDKKIIAYIKEAMKLNEAGVKVVKPKKEVDKNEIAEPDYFQKALQKNKKALATYEAFSASCKREYLDWIKDAKTEITRDKRLAQAIEWMSEGKKRLWKYEK